MQKELLASKGHEKVCAVLSGLLLVECELT